MKIAVIIIGVLVFTGLIMFNNSHAADWRIYTETGGMNVNENDISEGHKSYHLLGVEGSVENMRSKVLFGADGFFRGEPAEEDPEIPQWGAGAHVEYGYKWKELVTPYLGIRYDHIERGVAPKYSDPTDPEYNEGYRSQVESEHDIVSARGGVHLKYKLMYVDLGTIIPFYTSTKSGNFGPDVGIGIEWNNWDLGYRYKEIRMSDNHFEGDTALSFYFSGVQLGYTF